MLICHSKNGPNKTIEKSRKQFRSMTDPSSPEVHIFIIELQGGTPLPIGIVGTFRPRELGYSIHPDHWGTGYATEAATAFCEWHRLVYPDTTMFVKCFAENLSSVKVLKRCGFTEATETELMADPAMTVDEARDTFVDRTSKYVRESE